MTNNSAIGKIGEDIACKFLREKGYKILERNFRKKWGELDIISKDRKGILVFVEVKTIDNLDARTNLLPEENLTKSKLQKLQRTAMLYAGEHNELVKYKLGWRIDLVAITLNENKNTINHYENI